jgi:hypothetical protein
VAIGFKQMPVVLRRSVDVTPDLGHDPGYDRWCAVPGVSLAETEKPRLAEGAARLEAAFEGIREHWWQVARIIGKTPSAELAHMPTAGTYASDFGLMLAWVRLTGELAREKQVTLLVCDDPWLFRVLASQDGVDSGAPPPLLSKIVRLRLRGVMARVRVAGRVLGEMFTARRIRDSGPSNAPTLIVYGHPDSRGDGFDAYFGNLMDEIPYLRRMMHTDCPASRAKELTADGRTGSLHRWGRLKWIIPLLWTRWRPAAADIAGAEGLLVARAAEIEGSGGSAAMTRWQIRCQRAWLEECEPVCISWPWENHPWERDVVRTANRKDIRTIGFQHTVIGPHMFGHSPEANTDGLDSIPGLILCNGPAYRDNLADRGIPEQRLAIGGNLRLAEHNGFTYDPAGPVFVALPGHLGFSSEMMEAVYPLGLEGARFIFKVHPMYDFAFAETENISRTYATLEELPGVSAVLYCLGTIGLEALLSGMPTLRFRPRGDIALNTLPPAISACAVDAETLAAALTTLDKPETPTSGTILSPFDGNVWKQAFGGPEFACNTAPQ